MTLFVWALITGCGTTWTPLDLDGDGSSYAEDCDETNPNIGPNAVEDWYNGIDENCDGNDADKDGDGFVPDFYVEAYPNWADFPMHLAAGDCWDDPQADGGDYTVVAGQNHDQPTAAQVNPDAIDLWYDGPDQNCSGNDDFDADGDGFQSAHHVNHTGDVGDDCYDIESEDFPGEGFAPLIAEGCQLDVDGDGIEDDPPEAPDPAEVNPDAEDTWYDAIDHNCDANDWDADGDFLDYYDAGVPEADSQCDDCDDEDPEIYPNPSVPEVWYNGIDENCDNNDGDMDRDGYVDALYTIDEPDWKEVNPFKLSGDCWDDLTDPGTGTYSPALNGEDDLLQEDVHPDAEDIVYDGIDADCAEDSDFDADLDGFDSDSVPNRDGDLGDDCDDALDSVNVDAKETCDTSYDDDCDGDTNDLNAINSSTWYFDGDEDGQGDENNVGAKYCEANTTNGYTSDNKLDCRDSDDTTYDGATEICDGQDNNCDGSLPSDEVDDDGDKAVECTFNGGWDGFDSTQTIVEGDDCADDDNKSYPSATEICDGMDNNTCSTTTLPADEVDNDGDDFVECDLDRAWQGSGTIEGGDCLDTNDDAYPGAAFNESSTSCREDADGDGYGDSNAPSGVTDGDDCDDTDVTIYGGATEVFADGIDQDCNLKDTCYRDDDSDGYGDSTGSVQSSTNLNCDRKNANMADDSNDCDDDDSTVYPGATELCDGQLNDCNGSQLAGEVDSDGDQYAVCELDSGGWDGSGTVVGGEDCDDGDANVNPGETETVANDTDDDCDGEEICYVDSDGDGEGSTSQVTSSNTSCTDTGESEDNTDCDDGDDQNYTSATEICDGIDNNTCSTSTLPANEVDNDSDGYVECTLDRTWQGSGSKLGDDCDDTDATVSPGDSEVCDGQDNDCDSTIPTNEVDNDSDGYVECTLDSGGWDGTGSKLGEDCDDTDSGISPGDAEITADGIDQDCDTHDDCYDDDDGDGEGSTSTSTGNGLTCGNSGEATDNTDCDDTDSTVNTGATELCDGQINNCSTGSLPTNESDDDSDGFVECTLDGGGWDGTGSKEGGDCLDSNADAFPGSAETESPTSCREDADNDGYGDDSPPSGVTAGTDCDDGASGVNTAATEITADGTDQDCDTFDDCYADTDGDGDGSTSTVTGTDLTCANSGESDNSDDCDDGDDQNYGSNTETCDDQDNDCDDIADESCYSAGDVFFTEFMRSSDYSTDPDGEWFEVYNDSGADITGDGWEFVKGSVSFFVAPGTVTLPDADYTTFCYTDDTLATDCDYVYGGEINNGTSSAGVTSNSSWSMGSTPNFSLKIGGTTIDSVPMGTNSWAGPTTGASFQLDTGGTFNATDNDTEANWCEVESGSPHTYRYYNTGGSSDYGTPLADAACAP
jgi:large repetitive protein